MPQPARHLRNQRGFTLIEIAVVLAILGTLSTLALTGFGALKSRAQESLLKDLQYTLKVEANTWVNDYDLAHRWGANYNILYLNGRLEKTLEPKAGKNIYGFANPFSRSQLVLVSNALPAKSRNPAIFMTNNRNYSWAVMRETRAYPDLRGSMVIYLDNKVPQVDVFYVDLAGFKSRTLLNVKIGN